MNSSSIARQASRNRWAALVLIVSAQFMVVLDMSIVNVALASIKSSLDFSQASLQWVITAYAITFGGFLLLGGRLADILGRRRVFMTGIAVFTLGSVLSGLAWSATSLVVFRGLQGAGGALFAPAGLSLLMTAYREGRERNVALGVWGAASGSGAAVGVLLGGVLTSYLSWPWIFYINVPVGLALIALVPRFIAEARGDLASRHFDVAGATTITAALMLLVYALTRATQDGWGTPTTVTLLVASGLLATAFVVIERRAESPLLPFQAFRGNTLGIANVITCIIAAIAFSQFFLLTLYLQQVLHYSAAESGLAFAAIAVTVALMSNVAQRLVTLFGARRVLAAGLLSMGAAQALLVRLPVHGTLPGRPAAVVHPRRPGAGRLIRCGDDRGSRRSAAGKRRHRIRPRQHEPPDRRGARPRRDHDGRDHLHDPPVREPLGSGGHHTRVPRGVRRADDARPRRRGADTHDAGTHSRSRRTGAGSPSGVGGGSMTNQDAVVLDRRIDDLLLQARGLVLVREVLAGRGATRAELDAHTRELERVRHELVEAIG